MVHNGYKAVTILDGDREVEAKIIRTRRGGIDVWTPRKENKGSISSYVGTLFPRFQALMDAARGGVT